MMENLFNIIRANIGHALMITGFVFVMMLFVDYLNVLTEGKISAVIKKSLWHQYIMAAFLGAIPGCLGAFMVVSFYIRGTLSFGALAAAMIATSGDESYVMFSLFPLKALLIHVLLFVLGIIGAFLIDKIITFFKLDLSCRCELAAIHTQDRGVFTFKNIIRYFKRLSFPRFLLLFLFSVFLYGFAAGVFGPKVWNWQRITFIFLIVLAFLIVATTSEHYLNEHIWNHIVKKHLWRIFLWSFFALFFIDLATRSFNLESFIESHMFYIIIIAAFVGIIPESGPHLVFVMLFFKKMVPFSVLITSSIVQDGHGMLPLLSYSVKNSLWVKFFNLIFGLIVGYTLYYLGM